jgi:hypothetical protein
MAVCVAILVAHFLWHISCFKACHCAECHYAKCYYAERHYAECYCAECHYAECYYAECHYDEYNYTGLHFIEHLHFTELASGFEPVILGSVVGSFTTELLPHSLLFTFSKEA